MSLARLRLTETFVTTATKTLSTWAPQRAPGPAKQPLFMGSLSHMRRNPLQLLLQLQHQYGDIVRFRLGPYIIHTVTDPKHIAYVLQDNNANYVRGRMYQQFQCFMGSGLLTNDGEKWLTHRRMVQPLFSRRSVDTMASTMTGFTAEMLDRWDVSHRQGEAFDIVPEMMHLSLNILSRIMFSFDLSSQMELYSPAVRFSLTAMIFTGSLAQLLPSWLPLPYHLRVKRDRAALHGLIDQIVAAHKSGDTPEDLVSLLLSARDTVTGQPLTDTEVRDELMTIFLAGHETTGTGLSWMFYALSKHADVCRKLEEEVDQVLDGRPPILEDLARMPYSRMVVDEALRMYPPIWLYPRDAAAEDEIGGYQIPKGSSVFLTPYVTHRHPALWDNPEAFDPERFTPDKVAARPRFAYFPFGGGQRQCIGNHMALLQMQMVLIMVAQRYRLQVVPGHPVEPAFLVSLRPVHGIPMKARRRTPVDRAPGKIQAATQVKTSGCPFSVRA
jgi:cytochrome P450